MTEEEAKKLHYELWDWLSHNPSKDKKQWPGFYDEKGNANELYWMMCYNAFCFACYIGEQINMDGGTGSACRNCPLEREACLNPRSYYYKWEWGSKTTRSKYARLIRDSWTREVTPL